jgi:predicted nucleic acid-binding protein
VNKVFLDTNVIVYGLDSSSRTKQKRARALLREAGEQHKGVISTQVMQEFYVAATRKLNADPLHVKEILHSLMHFEVVTVGPHLINEAIDCSILQRVSFRDALIVVTAESARCSEVWSEDLSDGQVIRGVKINNPFK